MGSVQLSILTVFWVVSNLVLTAGVIYGWTGLQRQLKKEGQFSGGCPAGQSSSTTCASQDDSLSLIAIVAFNLANAATVVHGFALDRFGVRANAVCGGLLFTIGMLLLSVSSSASFNAFIPAYTLLGWGGIAVYLSSFQFANLYPNKPLWRAILASLFTSAGITFTLVDFLYDAHYSRDHILGIYTSIAAALTIGMLALYPVDAYEDGDECSLPIVEWYTGRPPIRHHRSHPKTNGLSDPSDSSDAPADWSVAAASVEGAGLGLTDDVPLDTDSEGIGHAYERGAFLHKGATAVTSDAKEPPPLSAVDERKEGATLWEEVKDPQTLLLALFFSFGLLFSNWYNATIGTQLTNMGDTQGHWAIAFIFISSFLPIPIAALISWFFRVLRYSGSVLVCVLVMGMSYLPLYENVLGWQFLGFIFYTLARAIVITVMFSYVATQYRADHYGRVVAIVTIIATPIGFLQLVMQYEVQRWGYRAINTVCALGILPVLLYAYYLRRKGI